MRNGRRFPRDVRSLHTLGQCLISQLSGLSVELGGRAGLFLAQRNSNLNIDSPPYNLLFYKQGLISPSPAHSGDSGRSRDNCVHYLQPQLAVQRGILLQLIISRVPASSVSIRRHSAFLPRGRENEQLRSLSQVLPLTPASLPRDHSELHWAEAHLPHLTGGCPSEAAL